MKRMLYKGKGVLALALVMSLCGTQTFAAQSLSAKEEVAQAQALPQLTVAEALAKAKKHSPDLREIQNTLNYLDDTMDYIDHRAGGMVTVPDVEYKKWVSDGWQKLVSAVYQAEQGQKQARIGEKLQNLGLELSVKSYFTSIKSNEDTLALAKKNAELQKKLYVQGAEKNRMGLLSQYKLEQLELAAKQAQDRVALLETSMEQIFIKLNDLMGENADARFEYVYDVSFTPYRMTLDMEQYISTALKEDLTIQMQELALDSAKFSKNFVSDLSTPLETRKQELDYNNAKRAYKTAKTEKATVIRSTYLQLQQMETQILSAQSDLTKAQTDYRVAQVNLQAGNVTKIAVEQAELGMIQAQNALHELVYQYDMLVYRFEHPSLLGSTAEK